MYEYIPFSHLLFCLLDENRVDGIRKDKVVPEGRGGGERGGGVRSGGGRGRGVDCPNKEKQREPADR